MDDLEADIEGLDLSQPMLFSHSARLLDPKRVRSHTDVSGTDESKPRPTPVAATRQPILGGHRSSVQSTPTLPERARHTEKSAQRFYFQLLEYFVFLLMRFKALDAGDKRGGEAQGYDELAGKVTVRAQQLLNAMVVAGMLKSR